MDELTYDELFKRLEEIKHETHGVRIEMIPYNTGGFSYECRVNYRDYPAVHQHGKDLKEAMFKAIVEHNRSFGRKE